jgi:hypothetical protein
LALLGILATVILIRAAGFDSRQIQSEPLQAIAIDRVALVKRLSEAIRFKTYLSKKRPIQIRTNFSSCMLLSINRFHGCAKASIKKPWVAIACSILGRAKTSG